MNRPRVSICLPNLNNHSYLEERLATIFAQTFSDWELVVYDNYSEDGAWEFFQKLERSDSRVRIAQAPREGMYANWNNCVRDARGDYVYIATSDDTMAPDCLEKLVTALENHPECDLAHCKLRPIDEKGRDAFNWWSHKSMFALSSGEFLHRAHIRRAPFDGLLHLLGSTIYISITQLLIRRSLFSRIGFFESRWGSVGDFNWDMRAGLVANTVHVPDTWGGWRQHANQATANAGLWSVDYYRKVNEMIEHAIESAEKFLAPQVRKPLRDWTEFLGALRICKNVFRRRMFLARCLLSGSWPARQHIIWHLRGSDYLRESGPKMIRTWVEQSGTDPVLIPA